MFLIISMYTFFLDTQYISMRKVILGQVFLPKVFGDDFCQAIVYALFRRSGDFTRKKRRNLLPFTFFLCHSLSLFLSLPLPLPFTSLSLLSFFLSGVCNERFRPCFNWNCIFILKKTPDFDSIIKDYWYTKKVYIFMLCVVIVRVQRPVKLIH